MPFSCALCRKSERNSAIFAAAAEIILALTCDIELPPGEGHVEAGENPEICGPRFASPVLREKHLAVAP